jgi:hypothetical protein
MLYHHCFSTLVWDMPLGQSKKTKNNWICMGHISFCPVLMTLYSGIKHRYHTEKQRSAIGCWLGGWSWTNPEKTKYMLRPPYQKAGPRHNTKKANSSFEDMITLKYLGTTLTDQKCIHEEIKSRLNSGNACYHSFQSLSSSRLPSRNVKVDICKTIILIVVLYGC